ncbi:MAG: hypothetical protein J6N76_06165 [Lachnospiraceae bacterium]|nr:hypothetical protein [Lachnospiraceae bacterium]
MEANDKALLFRDNARGQLGAYEDISGCPGAPRVKAAEVLTAALVFAVGAAVFGCICMSYGISPIDMLLG